jgi:very-short-patch-repair endonuclease
MPEGRMLPEPFRARPFAVREARDAGVGRGRLQSSDLARPFYGVRVSGTFDRLSAYAPRLRPGDRYSHTSAAALWGAPLPPGARDDVHVTAAVGMVRPRAAGVLGHRTSVTGDATTRNGLPVSRAVTAFVECAELLDLVSLVCIGDHLVLEPRVLEPHDVRPHCTIEELEEEAARLSRRGAVRARAAAELVRAGVESPMETRLRLLLQDAGIPEPRCGFELRTRRGRRIGWFDLAWPDRRVIAEYDGDQHRTSTEQYERDIRRFDEAADEGWRVIRVRRAGILRRPSDTVARVRRALSEHRGV